MCASTYTTFGNLTGHDDTLEEARCADTHANSVVNTPWPALLTVSMDLSVACSLNTEWVHGVRVEVIVLIINFYRQTNAETRNKKKKWNCTSAH